MSTARFEHQDLRGMAAIWALAAALLANACGDGSTEAVSLQSAGAATSERFHTLGGTISGLTRTGLVLANGANIVSVAANTTSFTLPTSVAYADGYGVTVATQPAGLSCIVSNGSGSMPASDVTSVKVKCLDDPDTVGGTAKGLNAEGLVLFLGLARSARFSGN
jgi:hypothetical protein